jgi:S-DNA-T family DNA segregation ATPase FtsK/SpoIIIE
VPQTAKAHRNERAMGLRTYVHRLPHGREIAALVVGSASVLMFLALASYSPGVGGSSASNLVGPAGVLFADICYWSFGAASYFFLILTAAWARGLYMRRPVFERWEEATGYLLALMTGATLLELLLPSAQWYGHEVGGWLGESFALLSAAIVGRVGATVCSLSMLLVAFIFITESSVVALGEAMIDASRRGFEWARDAFEQATRPRTERRTLAAEGPSLRQRAGDDFEVPSTQSEPFRMGDTDHGHSSGMEIDLAGERPDSADERAPGARKENRQSLRTIASGLTARLKTLLPSPSRRKNAARDESDDDGELGDGFDFGVDDDESAVAQGDDWARGWKVDDEDDSPVHVAPLVRHHDKADNGTRLDQHRASATPVRASESSAARAVSTIELPPCDDSSMPTGVWTTQRDSSAVNRDDAPQRRDDEPFSSLELNPQREQQSVAPAPLRRGLPTLNTQRDEPSLRSPQTDVRPNDTDGLATLQLPVQRAARPLPPLSDDSWNVDVGDDEDDDVVIGPATLSGSFEAAAQLLRDRWFGGRDATQARTGGQGPRESASTDENQHTKRTLRTEEPPASRPNDSQHTPAPHMAHVPRPATRTVEVSIDDIVSDEPCDTGPNRVVATSSGPVEPLIVESEAQKVRKRAVDLERATLPRAASDGTWQFPPLSFLNYVESDGSHIDHDKLKQLAVRLQEVLASFKVYGKVTGICPGPVVTRFEFEPEAGNKISKISGLSDDIAMALRAFKVRIIAPIPGKGVVGIEVPNDKRESVYLKEILADDRFTSSKSKLTVGLGKDIEGFPVVADLAKMPHLLIAGTTGAGKSVTVNAMITSILYNASPDDVRMILIDPKQLEFALYQHMPHLLLPVVTDPAKANTALQWAVVEMERRYRLMADMKVRNLDGYNARLIELQENFEATILEPRKRDPLCELLDLQDPDGKPTHRRMSYILIIVDEFADLMMTSGKEVEVAVARLAQKARAAGLHLMLATQRPSVDVLTGVIKANFPTRMSCRLMSGTDSRTVLDSIGAENLLGMGDMLYRANGSQDLTRVHGAYVDEREIEKVVEFLKAQRAPEYDETILKPQVDESADAEEEDYDELYDEAVQSVIEAGQASISMVQRKFRIGYNRSARMIERMEKEGIVGPSSGGAGRREVLVGQLFKG